MNLSYILQKNPLNSLPFGFSQRLKNKTLWGFSQIFWLRVLKAIAGNIGYN
jgi:hypothetical protein